MNRALLSNAYWILALLLRFAGQVYPIPKYAIVPLELGLLAGFFYENRERLEDFFITRKGFLGDAFLGLLIGAALACLEALYDDRLGESHSLFRASLLYLPLALVIVGWASSLYEELLFRSALMGTAKKHVGPLAALILQSIVFFFAHARYFAAGRWHSAIATGLIGLALGAVTLKRKSLTPAWIAHAVLNTYGIVYFPTGEVLSRILSSWI
jgi:membrane protease YdiL (CAAX protease family)